MQPWIFCANVTKHPEPCDSQGNVVRIPTICNTIWQQIFNFKYYSWGTPLLPAVQGILESRSLPTPMALQSPTPSPWRQQRRIIHLPFGVARNHDSWRVGPWQTLGKHRPRHKFQDWRELQNTVTDVQALVQVAEGYVIGRLFTRLLRVPSSMVGWTTQGIRQTHNGTQRIDYIRLTVIHKG